MKRWTNQEIASLSASVAENGYSKGIRAFINSQENENGRSFSSCEYMLSKQKRIRAETEEETNFVSTESDAIIDLKAPEIEKHEIHKKPKKKSFLARLFNFFK